MKKIETSKIAELLNEGKILVMPTDTVYGLACSVDDPGAMKKMYEIKQRDGKPGTIIAGSIEQLAKMGFKVQQINQAAQFWPGPVSVILDAPESLEYLHMGMRSLAVRIPALAWLGELLELTGPIATTSANLAGEPTVTNIEQAKLIFGDKVDLFIDGGEISGVKPSKIVRIARDDNIEVLRP